MTRGVSYCAVKNLPLLAIFAALLAGCSTAYQPDLEGKPAATLRLASVHPAESRVAVLVGDCVPFVRKDWETGSRAIAVLKDSASVSQKVPAGQPLTVAFFTSTTRVQGDLATDEVCAVGLRFTPEGGADYEAVFAGDGEGCRVDLGKMRPKTGEGARTEPVFDAKELPGC